MGADLSAKITDWLIKKGYLQTALREWYIYTLRRKLLSLPITALIFILGAFFVGIIPSFLFLTFFYSMRARLGGYHAKTPLMCFCMSLGICLFAFLVAFPLLLSYAAPASIIICAVSTVATFTLPIIYNASMHLDDAALRENKKRAKIIVSIQTIIVLVLNIASITDCALAASLGLFMAAMSALAVIIKTKEKQK